ncbi:protein artichoke-like [Uloborus diversus]|uniref:protein artichoke-like n=1 Tax=Uloborus diversus TaxID=327109 RepID=UPI00240965F8|nr:protein artichoke-like [Uloborus diversus]
MRILPFLLLLSICTFVNVYAGSPCPSRRDIYPCTCLNVKNGNRFTTIISCHRLSSSEALSENVLASLKILDIDQFFLYDSFWEAKDLSNQMLPHNWITMLKVTDYNIIDTKLSTCFACSEIKYTCENTYTKRFIVTNSSSSGNICDICRTDTNGNYSWTGCMSKLERFEFTDGGLEVLSRFLFPLPMRQLLVLNMTRNRIRTVEHGALQNMPNLKSLDLSHNMLKDVSSMFNKELKNLTLLNINWNRIKTIGTSLFKYLPTLNMFFLKSNLIVDVKEEEWKNVKSSVKVIDLTENPIHCVECGIRWINHTFSAKTVLRGHCKTPAQYAGHSLRAKATLFARKCDENGKLKKKTLFPLLE